LDGGKLGLRGIGSTVGAVVVLVKFLLCRLFFLLNKFADLVLKKVFILLMGVDLVV
jgi:hypothetical protein